MKAPDKDLRILTHIVFYCNQIDMAVDRFGKSYDIFSAERADITEITCSKSMST